LSGDETRTQSRTAKGLQGQQVSIIESGCDGLDRGSDDVVIFADHHHLADWQMTPRRGGDRVN
jgi:hypothetical protein